MSAVDRCTLVEQTTKSSIVLCEGNYAKANSIILKHMRTEGA